VPCDAARLASAVALANTAGAVTIRLARNCTYVVNDELSFTGTGHTTLLGGPSTGIKGNPAAPPFRILFVDSGVTLRVQGIFILGGNGGGGIANVGNLTLDHVTLTGNNANHGGGVFTDGEGSTNIIRTTIAANTAPQGGGLYNNTNGRTRLNRTVVRQNKADLVAPDNGGGIFDAATQGGVTLEWTAVRRNTPNNCTLAIPHCLG
jgi:hypothetical protein